MSENSLTPANSSFHSFIKQNWVHIVVLLYLASPIDIIPEAIFPFLGSVDDGIVAVLELYSLWRERNK